MVTPLSVARSEGDNPGDIGVSIEAQDRDLTSGNTITVTLEPGSVPFSLMSASNPASNMVVSSNQSTVVLSITEF